MPANIQVTERFGEVSEVSVFSATSMSMMVRQWVRVREMDGFIGIWWRSGSLPRYLTMAILDGRDAEIIGDDRVKKEVTIFDVWWTVVCHLERGRFDIMLVGSGVRYLMDHDRR